MVDTKFLKKLRIEKGMSQMELAFAAGVSQSHYCMIENGKDVPSIKRLAAIAKVLNCTVKDLVLDDTQG